MLRRREFIASALGLPARLPVDSPPLEQKIGSDYIRALLQLKQTYLHDTARTAILNHAFSREAADKLFFYELNWINTLSDSPQSLIQHVSYFAQRYVCGPDQVLINNTLSALDRLERIKPSVEEAIAVLRELYSHSPSMHRAKTLPEFENSIREIFSDLTGYIERTRRGIGYDHNHNIPVRIAQVYAAHPEANTIFQCEVERLKAAQAQEKVSAEGKTHNDEVKKFPPFGTAHCPVRAGEFNQEALDMYGDYETEPATWINRVTEPNIQETTIKPNR